VRRIVSISFLLSLVLSVSVYSQEFLKAVNKEIVDKYGSEVILRGLGLGGWMLQESYMLKTKPFIETQHELRDSIESLIGTANTDTFYNEWLANHCRKTDVDSLASWGFNCIRLPMHYNLFTLPIEEEPIPYENTWLEKGFELTDSLLSWCETNNMYLILDLHAAPGGQGHDAMICDYDSTKPSLWESSENRAKTVALWHKLAERYAGEPWIGGYDLINEPNWELPGNTLLRELYEEITDSIREVDTNHIIFIEGNAFANDFTGLTPPWDSNMVYSFHKYWNYNDQSTIQWMLDMRNIYNIPIWCGEAGENSNLWFRDAIKLLEDYDIGWSWWPLKKIDNISGPLSVERTEEYQTLLDYWENGGSKPTVAFAKAALMDLTEKLKLENCTYHPDVIDALFRQVQTNETKPYEEHHIPGLIFASDFDMGRNNYAYFDTDTANYTGIPPDNDYTDYNSGNSYRNDAVDIEPCTDTDTTNGYDVGWVVPGEWMNYTVFSDSVPGTYNVKYRVASAGGGGELKLRLIEGGDSSDLHTVNVPETGGWQNWQTVTEPANLPSGNFNLRLEIIDGVFNVNWFEAEFVSGIEEKTALKNKLYQNIPNPFFSTTDIKFSLRSPSPVTLKIYNLIGQEIEILVDEKLNAGTYNAKWSPKNLPVGLYFCRLKSDEFIETKKIILVR
jgi:endoglucanase